ncbi:MAG: DEAD/DEAH box helicase, partial [Eubacteriales bacterium]
MQGLNPVKKARYIEKGFREYISSTYNLDSDVYSKQFSEELKSTQLLKGPYIGKNLEFQTTKTINELIEEGLMSREFRCFGDMHLDRKLRSHQERAIRQIHKGHNLIITTGTGSGKTESFLYPVLNEILHEKNMDKPGVRAIFLFPMNALVNDQFDRVRKILSRYPKIKYGVFTGNTKNREYDIKGTKEYIKETTGYDILENELLDRQQIRDNPPHILFTNYSMLEYILLRPEDDALLTIENTKNWKFII